MDKYVVILCSEWKKGRFWEAPDKAPYLLPDSAQLSSWLELKDLLPLPGIGVYKEPYQDRPIKYLQIKSISSVEHEKKLYFDFEPISTGKSTSITFSQKRTERSLYSRLHFDEARRILKELSEEPPESWLKLAEGKVSAEPEWRDYVGKHFLRIEHDVSNDVFEDVIADLFRALEFEVRQMGHKVSGENPDGILTPPEPYDFAIVYDCKNSKGYYPDADDRRALDEYYEKFCSRIRANPRIKNVCKCFVAKSFESTLVNPSQVDVDILVDFISLLYLHYKQVKLGKDTQFTVFDIARKDKVKLDAKLIDKEMV